MHFSEFDQDKEKQQQEQADKVHKIEDEQNLDDELFVAFKKPEQPEENDDEDEDVPQNKPEYQVENQTLAEPIKGIGIRPIQKEVTDSFMEYAMSVIVSRALPDARDGLKPVHRRILYDMSELGINYNSPHRKSARIVGDVLGKYHPHGDSSVYEAMVRMAQDFSMRYPLVDGHGNFGSIDGDEPAAMRYTEARMSKLAAELLEDIKKNTVDFADNYDASEQEPSVLPARFPNLLVSGVSGIAVGMATSIPPHNLGEVIDAAIALAQNPEITIDELMKFLPGPDFPTGGTILGVSGIRNAYHTGKGSITTRAVSRIEEFQNGKSKIIVTEIPYEIKKISIVEKIAELVKTKTIEGIADLRDESSREGIRIVIDIKKNFNPHIILNQLYKQTNLQLNYSANLVALVDGQPKLLNLKEILQVYLRHYETVERRRLLFDLNKAEERLHILDGLKIAVQNIDEVVAIIKQSRNDAEAQQNLAARFNLSEKQTKAIVDMRLGRLTGLAIENMEAEIAALHAEIASIRQLLDNHDALIEFIIGKLTELKNKYADARRTVIDVAAQTNITDEDLIPLKNIVITTSSNGYVKRTPLEDYRVQNRGGKGLTTMKTYEDDDIASILYTTTHIDLLLFTNTARVYRIRAHQIPELSRQSKGIPFVNIVANLDAKNDEKIVSMLPVSEYGENIYLFTVTKNGTIKKTALAEYERVNTNGKYAFNLVEGDELIRAFLVRDDDLILIANNQDRVVKFNANDIRALGRTATGVRGIKLEPNQKAITASALNEGEFILTVGAKGFGKLSHESLFRLTNRGGKGVIGINSKLAGNLIFARFVNLQDEILIITTQGLTVRTSLLQLSVVGRSSKGVKLINLKDNDEIQAIEIIKVDENSDPEAVAKAKQLTAEIKAKLANTDPQEFQATQLSEEDDDLSASESKDFETN
ncbi:DNA gyrase subunit A [Mycoplasmopsis columbinasalis]|uniref:DNA gyrase subunit A n=1 Tax=Mycoplasmopsis columbinasalis TaxID=114880 RepID=A0A449B9Y7_9BACT|nr:DNA gyrase subunit A [Mycoplasmopsis columbinasalis]VEU78012.1 DNA gyrase subunit A [Mycoplasmopsis columbinasalis]